MYARLYCSLRKAATLLNRQRRAILKYRMRRFAPFYALALLLAILPLTGCLFHTHRVEESYFKGTLKQATQAELVNIIDQQAEKIQSLQATVDIDTSIGGAKKGQVTDYKEIRGYVLARKPAMLHMIGLLPIVRTTAFDMVSDGNEFKLWIPPKNRFVIGNNQVETRNPDHPMEDVRPKDIYDALLIQPITDGEIPVLENGIMIFHDSKGHRVLQDDYEIIVIRMRGNNQGILSRKIVFSRLDLLPHEQYIYDDKGNLVTDAHYATYKPYDGIGFPSRIEIIRPVEEYNITLNILKMEINKPLRDDQFALEQPPGAEVVHLDHTSSNVAVPPASEATSKR
jgi:outer membrane lipoprotein-sorting protein